MGYGRLFGSDGKYMSQVSNFYCKVDDNKMHIETDNGRNLIFNPGELLRDKQGDWHIRSMPDFYNLADIVDEALKREAKRETAMNAGSIKNVIFNPPATVVYWTDGTKTVVKCNENDIFDPEKGLALAVAKRCAGNHGAYYTEIRHWVEKCWKGNPNKPCTAEHSANLDAVKASIEKMNRIFDEIIDGTVAGNPARFMKNLCEMKASLAVMEQELYK